MKTNYIYTHTSCCGLDVHYFPQAHSFEYLVSNWCCWKKPDLTRNRPWVLVAQTHSHVFSGSSLWTLSAQPLEALASMPPITPAPAPGNCVAPWNVARIRPPSLELVLVRRLVTERRKVTNVLRKKLEFGFKSTKLYNIIKNINHLGINDKICERMAHYKLR